MRNFAKHLNDKGTSSTLLVLEKCMLCHPCFDTFHMKIEVDSHIELSSLMYVINIHVLVPF